jgi:hypothetical protein
MVSEFNKELGVAPHIGGAFRLATKFTKVLMAPNSEVKCYCMLWFFWGAIFLARYN